MNVFNLSKRIISGTIRNRMIMLTDLKAYLLLIALILPATLAECAPGWKRESPTTCVRSCKPGHIIVPGYEDYCAKPCPPTYRYEWKTFRQTIGEALGCTRSTKVIKADNSACPGHDKCGLVGRSKGCSKCPEGFHNHGCTCAHGINEEELLISQDYYVRRTLG
jgi:hypothetical protein